MIASVNTPNLESFKVEARNLLEKALQQNNTEPSTQSHQQDSVSLGNQPIDPGTYSAALEDASIGSNFTLLRDLFATTMKEQGIATLVATDNGEINLETLTPQEATELVSDDGYFGVDNTAQRIFDFATGLAGNDPSRLDAIISGIEDGFAQAEQAWGGTLPEISYATKDAVQGMLEDWSGQKIEFA